MTASCIYRFEWPINTASYIARYNVGMDIRERREQAGLTQAELARRSGIAQPNIAAYEKGRRSPSPANRQRLDEALRPLASQALRRHKGEILEILVRHHMTNPRVFGSAASQTDTPLSDLDLLVDATSDLDLLDVIDAADELETLLDVPVDIVTSRSLRPNHEIAASAVAI